METGACDWKGLLRNWPAELPRRGIFVTSLNDQVPFDGFLTSQSFVLAQRSAPDSMGARTVILPFDQIAALKLTDPAKPKIFQAMGFEGVLPKG
jgi:hypothetical protein